MDTTLVPGTVVIFHETTPYTLFLLFGSKWLCVTDFLWQQMGGGWTVETDVSGTD